MSWHLPCLCVVPSGLGWALDQSLIPPGFSGVLGWMEVSDSSLPARMQWSPGPGSLWVPGAWESSWHPPRPGCPPGSSQPLADADTDGSFPTFSSGSAERVKEATGEGPPEATAGGNNLPSAHFSFPLLIAELTSSSFMKGSFVSRVAGQSRGLAAGFEPRASPAHPSPAAGSEMILSATAMSLPLWLPSETKPNT